MANWTINPSVSKSENGNEVTFNFPEPTADTGDTYTITYTDNYGVTTQTTYVVPKCAVDCDGYRFVSINSTTTINDTVNKINLCQTGTTYGTLVVFYVEKNGVRLNDSDLLTVKTYINGQQVNFFEDGELFIQAPMNVNAPYILQYKFKSKKTQYYQQTLRIEICIKGCEGKCTLAADCNVCESCGITLVKILDNKEQYRVKLTNNSNHNIEMAHIIFDVVKITGPNQTEVIQENVRLPWEQDSTRVITPGQTYTTNVTMDVDVRCDITYDTFVIKSVGCIPCSGENCLSGFRVVNVNQSTNIITISYNG